MQSTVASYYYYLRPACHTLWLENKQTFWDMARIPRHLFSPDQFQPHPSLWAMNHSAISNPEGLQAQTGAPHHRHSSGVSASRHGAGHSRSCHPGRSRWDPPTAPHTCRIQSNAGASICHDLPSQQKPQCPLRLFDHHTVQQRRRREERKGKERKGKEREERWDESGKEERKGGDRSRGREKDEYKLYDVEREGEKMALEITIIFSRLKCFLLYICFIYLMKHQKESETSKTENIM